MFSRVLHAADWRGAYPERWEPRAGRLERLCAPVTGMVVRQVRRRRLRLQRLVRAVTAYGRTLEDLGEAQLRVIADDLRHCLRREGFHAEVVARAFALVREATRRTVGMRHFDVQVMGGWVLLHGMVAEMETGEGKTLTATLPACTAALSGLE